MRHEAKTSPKQLQQATQRKAAVTDKGRAGQDSTSADSKQGGGCPERGAGEQHSTGQAWVSGRRAAQQGGVEQQQKRRGRQQGGRQGTGTHDRAGRATARAKRQEGTARSKKKGSAGPSTGAGAHRITGTGRTDLIRNEAEGQQSSIREASRAHPAAQPRGRSGHKGATYRVQAGAGSHRVRRAGHRQPRTQSSRPQGNRSGGRLSKRHRQRQQEAQAVSK